MVDIATALKKWAGHHEISRERAADAFGVTTRTWERWTAGEGVPDTAQVARAEAEFSGLVDLIYSREPAS